MHRYDINRQRLALGLAFLAGQTDAIGFIVAGGYFTSFMSGNTTRLGVDLVEAASTALVPLGIIGSFLVGVVAGAMTANRWANWRKRILLAVVTLLLGLGAIAALGGANAVFLAAAAAAMGFANNTFIRNGEVTVGVTYMTGALVRFGQGLAARLSGRPASSMRGYGSLWLALATGAASGAWLYAIDKVIAPFAIFAVAGLLCAFAFRIEGSDS